MVLKHIKTKEEFEVEVKNSKTPVVVDFWAPWCGPCKMLGPVFEKLSEEISGVKFIKVDVDEAEDIASQFNIMSIPTLIFFKDGENIDQAMGAMGKDQLSNFINKNK